MSHEARQKAAFFRDSGWLMVANIISGGLMLCVHFLSQKVTDYGTVGALFGATIIIPSIPLQMIFTREAAAALAMGDVAQLATKARRSAIGLFLFWLVFLMVVVAMRGSIMEHWKITQPITLWMFMLVMLTMLVTPVFGGLLQGKQDFFWLGWTLMLNAFLRVGVAALVIFGVPGGNTAAGFMAGVLAGTTTVLIVTMWKTRDLWAAHGATFSLRPFLSQVTPLMVGFGACQLLFCFDTIIVGRFFKEPETSYYASAGTLSRALMWLVLPLVQVMFPKLVHSTAKSEKSNLFGLTLIFTGVLATVAGIGLSLLGAIPVKIVYGADRVAGAMAVIPWFALAMVPLTLGNVIVNALLAKSDLRVVPWLGVLAIGYGITLWIWHPSLQVVLQTLTIFTTGLLLAGAVFTWLLPKRASSA